MGGKTADEGIALYRAGNYAESLTYFLSLPAAAGGDAESAYFIGLSYMKLKRYEDALLYLEQVVTSAGSDDSRTRERSLQCRLVLAVIYSLTGRSRLADFELKNLEGTGYRPSYVNAALAYVAWEQSKFDECIAYYEKALELEPENGTALNGLGYVLACTEKDLTRALTLCKRALGFMPESAACLDSVGWVYYKLGLLKEAEIHLRKARERCAGNPEIAEHLKIVQEAAAGAGGGMNK
ncbi:tetratricopeptide repeat protein [Treponema brennaborense]|uniref:Tetratricopeptide TPR_2 repeat-containing protein n=1 Tax=Treponema brennaborense (strain DSM 12168 / CIP 105900 / DD5/3) TaxID=906968 RepID=F4LLG8_TREBD|nr:tetratricopeptide repeat protein [Treponema brennaborense]AEE16632.1 Tetratricopeptide TPR_2 repeat-containing protein [Treponema brennaborense DSM 12168]